MKKVLLSSAAALAFGAVGFGAAPASAQLELTITGSVDPQFGFVDQDLDETRVVAAGVGTRTQNYNSVAAAGQSSAGYSTGGAPTFSLISGALLAADPSATAANYASALGRTTVTNSRRSYASTTRFILRFNADGTADNGLRYGVRVRLDDNERFGNSAGSLYGDAALRTRGGIYIRELWGYVRGGWGEVRAGESPIVFNLLSFDAPNAALGVDGDWDRYVFSGTGSLGVATNFNNSIVTRDNSGHPSGLTYILQNFHGFSFGLTYAPTTQGFERTADLDENNAGFSDLVSIAAQYRGEFSGVRVGVSGAVNFASAEPSAIGGIANDREDLLEWRVGGMVGYGGFTLSGFYANAGDSGYRTTAVLTNQADDFEAWAVGGAYTVGPWNFAVNYIEGHGDPIGLHSATVFTGGVDTGFGTRDEASSMAVGGGVSYNLAPGLTPYATVVYFENESILTSNSGVNGVTDFSNDGVVGTVGVTFTF